MEWKDLYNVMQHAHTVDRPVKITNLQEKNNEFNKNLCWH